MTDPKGLYLTYEETIDYLGYLLINEELNSYTIGKVLTYAIKQEWKDIFFNWKNRKPFVIKDL